MSKVRSVSETTNERSARRTRLDTGRRREQLLGVGAELFAQRTYDDVGIERVAEFAGVSRGLLYHYFPTKRDFFAAVVRTEGERLLQLTVTAPGPSAAERFQSALDAFLTHARERPQGFRAFHRAAAHGDPAIRRIHDDTLAVLERRVLDELLATGEAARGPDGPGGARASARLRLAVRGWLAFLVTVCLEWLEEPARPLEEIRALCTRTLLAAVTPAGGRP